MVQLMLTHHMRRQHAEAKCADLRALRNAAGRRPADLVDERSAPMLYQVTDQLGTTGQEYEDPAAQQGMHVAVLSATAEGGWRQGAWPIAALLAVLSKFTCLILGRAVCLPCWHAA